jgi:tetratricopeptide (TPR) repeat protein
MIDIEIALSYFLWSKGYWDESVVLASHVYEIQYITKNWQSVRFLTFWLSFVCLSRNDMVSAKIWIRRCIDAQHLDGDYIENPDLLFLSGQIEQRSGNYAEAELTFKKVVSLWEGGKKINIALVFGYLGLLEVENKRYKTANDYYEKASEFAQDIELESKETQPYFMSTLGRLALELRLYLDARKWFDETLAIARDVGNIEAVGQSQYGLACVYEKEEEIDLAVDLASEALRIFERLQHRDLADARELVEKLKTKIHR